MKEKYKRAITTSLFFSAIIIAVGIIAFMVWGIYLALNPYFTIG